MYMYEMKEEFFTGIEEIDNQHKVLFEIADKIYYLLKDEFAIDKYDKIVQLIEELKDYTSFHFATEEAYMEKIKYKRMFTQKIDHNNFVQKLEDVDLREIDENQEETILQMLEFVNEWLIEHILKKDKFIGVE